MWINIKFIVISKVIQKFQFVLNVLNSLFLIIKINIDDAFIYFFKSWLYYLMSQFPDPIHLLLKIDPHFPMPPCRHLSWLHSAVSHEGHLDVVCASSREARPYSGSAWYRGPGGCGGGKEINLLILFMSNQ